MKKMKVKTICLDIGNPSTLSEELRKVVKNKVRLKYNVKTLIIVSKLKASKKDSYAGFDF